MYEHMQVISFDTHLDFIRFLSPRYRFSKMICLSPIGEKKELCCSKGTNRGQCLLVSQPTVSQIVSMVCS